MQEKQHAYLEQTTSGDVCEDNLLSLDVTMKEITYVAQSIFVITVITISIKI